MLKWIRRKIADKAPDAAIPVADLASRQMRQPQHVKEQGDEHVKAGRHAEAREVLERAVRIAAEDADSHYLLASILEATGPRDAEISHLQKAIHLRPDFEFARRQLIIALFKSDRCAEAAKLCEESMAILPESGELHFYRSNLYLHAGETAPAI